MDKKAVKKRIRIFLVILIIAFLALIIRLFFLQVVAASQWQVISEQNRLRLLSIPARRGDLVTADGVVLATSKPVFSVSVMPGASEDKLAEVSRQLAAILKDETLTGETIMERVKASQRRFEPVEIKRLIPGDPGVWEIITKIEEHRRDLPGVVIKEQPMRDYPYRTIAGHLTGFIGQITKDELAVYQEDNYNMNDKIGKSGLERAFESVQLEERNAGLRGKKGVYQVEVDVYNRIVRDLGTIIPPTPGDNIRLTLDFDLQQTLEQSMAEVVGALAEEHPKAKAAGAVVLDVNTGAILALASTPGIDPNVFVDGSLNDPEVYDYYFPEDSSKGPMFNRAVQGVYPPGSTFKPITAMAALASGAVSTSDTVTCNGAYWRPPYIKCWDSHGVVNFYRAMAVSCNTYFQDAGYKAGIEEINRVAREFGLGQPLEVAGIFAETSGLLPTPEWKKERYAAQIESKYQNRQDDLEKEYATKLAQAETVAEREKIMEEKERDLRVLEARKKIEYNFNTSWQDFDTFNTSIGQGSNLYSALQLSNYIATLANGGKRWRPYLVDAITSPEGKLVKQYQPELLNEVTLDREVLAATRDAMLGVTQPGGTAYSLFRDFPKNIAVGAKTGTAQTGLAGDDSDADFHGVFIAFAPADNPQIAFAGIVEYGESGSGSAGKLARAVFQEYFGLVDKE